MTLIVIVSLSGEGPAMLREVNGNKTVIGDVSSGRDEAVDGIEE